MGAAQRPDARRLDAEGPEARLVAAAADQARRDSVLRRLAVAEQQFEAAQHVATITKGDLGDEDADVTGLESLSLPRLLASLRGSRATDLDRDRAKQKRAEYCHAIAVAGRDSAAADREALREALAATAGADERYAAALRAVEAWLASCSDNETAQQLARMADRRGRLEALETETRQAVEAGREALEALTLTRAELSSADRWDVVDVFAKGGFLADSAQRNRMDRASRSLHAAEMALRRFSRDLKCLDCAIEAVPLTTGRPNAVQLNTVPANAVPENATPTNTTQTDTTPTDIGPADAVAVNAERIDAVQLNLTLRVLELVFDNVFTDLTVLDDNCEASRRARLAHHAVIETVAELEDRLLTIEAERQVLEDQRAAPLPSCAAGAAG
jgi:hypothetical protein